MENKSSAPVTPKAPNTWISYVQKVSGASYQHTSGAEAKTFLGFSHATHVGLKSEVTMAGLFKNIVGPDFSMQFAPLVGGKKDRSWGDKREWRKGDISLRCIGKKEDFVFLKEEFTKLSDTESFTAAKKEKTRLDTIKTTNLAKEVQQKTIDEAKKQMYREFTSTIHEINAKKFQLNVARAAQIKANKLDVGAVQALSLTGSRIKLAAPTVKILGKINLGGIAVPDLATAAQLAKLEAVLLAQEAAITALKLKGQAMRARSLSMMLPT